MSIYSFSFFFSSVLFSFLCPCASVGWSGFVITMLWVWMRLMLFVHMSPWNPTLQHLSFLSSAYYWVGYSKNNTNKFINIISLLKHLDSTEESYFFLVNLNNPYMFLFSCCEFSLKDQSLLILLGSSYYYSILMSGRFMYTHVVRWCVRFWHTAVLFFPFGSRLEYGCDLCSMIMIQYMYICVYLHVILSDTIKGRSTIWYFLGSILNGIPNYGTFLQVSL